VKSNTTALRQVMADVFGLAPEAITEDASIDSIDAWDSLKHLNLVLALEERFAVSFTEQETVEILNYELIRTVLSEHGVEFAD
jgi:acyl carrier protein